MDKCVFLMRELWINVHVGVNECACVGKCVCLGVCQGVWVCLGVCVRVYMVKYIILKN